jgi:hypothetical protein
LKSYYKLIIITYQLPSCLVSAKRAPKGLSFI